MAGRAARQRRGIRRTRASGWGMQRRKGSDMARKPNYRFERLEREKAKAAKKAARLEAKQRKAEERKLGKADEEDTQGTSDSGGSATAT